MISLDFFNLNDMVAMSNSVSLVHSGFPKFSVLCECEKKIGSYLAGLWEGDGHVVLPSLDHQGCVKNTPCVAITASHKQLLLFKAFEHKFGG